MPVVDENVVFTNPDGQAPQNGQPPATPDPNAPAPADPNAVPPADPGQSPTDPAAAPADPSAPADPNATGTASGDGTTPPPPPAPGNFFNSGIFRGAIIGLVVLIVIILVVFMLLPKKQAPVNVKLTWWGLWEDSKTVQPIIDTYQQSHPNITVEYVKQDPEDYRTRLLTRIQNGTGPDIFRFHNSWFPVYYSVLQPLSSTVVSPDEFKQDFYPVAQSDLVWNGAIYGIPLEGDTLEMFVNTDMFDKAGIPVPNNWTDFVKDSKKLTVKDPDTGKIKTAGAALGTYTNVTHATDILSLLFVQQGLDIKHLTDKPQSEIDAIDFYTSFVQGDDAVWSSDLDPSKLAFSKGNLAMYIGYSWDVFDIKNLNPNLHYKIYPIPTLELGKNITIASYWIEGLNNKSQHQKEAEDFLHYLMQKPTMQKLYSEEAKTRLFGEPYMRSDLANTLKDDPLVYPFASQLQYAHSTYFASDTHDGDGGLNTSLNQYVQDLLSSILVDQQQSKTSIEGFNNGVSQVYQKFNIGQPAAQ